MEESKLVDVFRKACETVVETDSKRDSVQRALLELSTSQIDVVVEDRYVEISGTREGDAVEMPSRLFFGVSTTLAPCKAKVNTIVISILS